MSIISYLRKTGYISLSQPVMKPCLLLISLLINGQALATHLIGGYIQAKSTGGLRYEITVTLYVDGQSATNDDRVSLCFGDGTTQSVLRVALTVTNDRRYSISTYRVVHTYAGPATYQLVATQSNRGSSRNIRDPASQQSFTLSTTFLASANQTPTLAYPATGFRTATNQRAVISLRASDNEGDSLAYRLAWPLIDVATSPCVPGDADGYQYPNDVTRRGTFRLDGLTGDLVWDAPTMEGNYSIAIMVREYRNGALISQTVQEISLLVEDRSGTPPSVIPPYEPAATTGLITANSPTRDEDVTLTLFPNPVDDRLQVVVQTSNPATARMQLLDSNGRMLHDMVFGRLARRHEQVISMGSLTPGVYMLRARIGDRTLVQKVMKR